MKLLLVLAVVLPLAALAAAGSLMAAADDLPERRAPIVLREGETPTPVPDPTATPTATPTDTPPGTPTPAPASTDAAPATPTAPAPAAPVAPPTSAGSENC